MKHDSQFLFLLVEAGRFFFLTSWKLVKLCYYNFSDLLYQNDKGKALRNGSFVYPSILQLSFCGVIFFAFIFLSPQIPKKKA